MFRSICMATVVLALGAANVTGALAHVTLETQQAAVGSGYKAILRVPHGCAGSSTVSIRIRVADGVVDVKPMPKAGWKLETKTTKSELSRAGGAGCVVSSNHSMNPTRTGSKRGLNAPIISAARSAALNETHRLAARPFMAHRCRI